MRIRIELEVIKIEGALESREMITLPIRYQGPFLSLLKRGLQHESPRIYQELYETRNHEKMFSQALVFHKAKFSKEEITLENNKVTWLWSGPLADESMAVFNAFQYLKKENTVKLLGNLFVKIKNVQSVFQEPIRTNTGTFRLISPLIVRQHNIDTKKDWFYGYEDEQFVPVLKENLKRKLCPYFGKSVDQDIDNLIIEPINMKKTVVKQYEKQIEANLGSIRLVGERYLLNFLRDSSLSSRSGLFNGYMNQV
jgi:CRISPR-associated endoribonuclease Cas6